MQSGASAKSKQVDEIDDKPSITSSVNTPSLFSSKISLTQQPTSKQKIAKHILSTQQLPHLQAEEQRYLSRYQHRLSILRLSAKALASFFYMIDTEILLVDGDNKVLNGLDYCSLSRQFLHSPFVLHLLENAMPNVFDIGDKQLMVMLVVNDSKQATGLIGGVISKDVTVEKTSQKIIKLIMQEFAADLIAQSQAKRQHAIQSQHLQLSALNKDYICIKDSGHRIVYANPALLETFPASAQPKIFGYTTANFYDPDSCAKIIDSDLTALSTGYFKGNEYIKLANGTEKILLTTKKAFNGIDGKKYLMSVSRDVTEKEILINDLKRSNEDLDNFAYVASHDLRAPLNAIKRLVSFVKEDCDSIMPTESKEDLAIVLGRVDRMEKLLVDLLAYSRIGKEYQEAVTINLRDFVIELLSLIDLPMGFVFKCDKVDITVPEVPFNVVMLNLVSNAIKHHDSGNAKIEIKAKSNEQGTVITVLDNGPGIEEKNRERIFKLFETLKPRDEVEGSGMGLSVVKKIVEHYGGSIKVAANKPRGTKFIVTWPIHNIARTVLDGLQIGDSKQY